MPYSARPWVVPLVDHIRISTDCIVIIHNGVVFDFIGIDVEIIGIDVHMPELVVPRGLRPHQADKPTVLRSSFCRSPQVPELPAFIAIECFINKLECSLSPKSPSVLHHGVCIGILGNIGSVRKTGMAVEQAGVDLEMIAFFYLLQNSRGMNKGSISHKPEMADLQGLLSIDVFY